jgi:hypothetical protein
VVLVCFVEGGYVGGGATDAELPLTCAPLSPKLARVPSRDPALLRLVRAGGGVK